MLKLRYKKDKRVFIPERDIDLPDNYEIELPDIEKASSFDKDKLIREIEEDGKKYFPDFKLNEQIKELLGILNSSELRNLSDEDLKRMYHENVWKAYDDKYSS